MNDIKNNKLTFKVRGEEVDLEGIEFEVVSFEGREAISESYEFKLNLRSKVIIKSRDLLGRRGTLTIEMAKPDTISRNKSTYHGIIFKCSNTEKIGPYYHYELTLEPKLSKLKYTEKSEIFVDSRLSDIINATLNTEVFTKEDQELAFDIEDIQYKSSDDIYNRYSYVCQYEESDYNFINRLLERDGIYYYFEQGNKQEKLIITDSNSKFLSREEKLSFRPLNEQTGALDPNALNSIKCKHEIVPNQVTIKNFGYEKAHLGDKGVISCSAPVGNEGDMDNLVFVGEKVIYGENFVNPDNNGDGEFLANIRAEEIYCRSKVYFAKSTIVPVLAGMRVNIEDNKYAEFNGEYLVIEVLHRGYQQHLLDIDTNGSPFYENTLVLIPASVQFRPERKASWPSIYGTMNALIDSEDNQNDIPHIDGNGRYKILLPFPHTAKAEGRGSIWLRLATPYAGNGYGLHFPLHKGTEVVLSFRNGNPDLPVIMGAVFNSLHQNVVINENAYFGGIILTKGGNMMSLNDSKDGKSIGWVTENNWKVLQ